VGFGGTAEFGLPVGAVAGAGVGTDDLCGPKYSFILPYQSLKKNSIKQ
jgi:hypothetical protein